MVVKFITLKWGTKYSAQYVNKLYHSIEQTYSDKFEFHCFTDDYTDINKNCQVKSIETLPNYNNKLFTFSKIDLFAGLPFEGPYVLLDLDLLILKDLKPYFDEYKFKEPRIGYCYWTNPERIYESHHKGDCYVNSSFVTWDGDQLKHIYDTYISNKKIVDYKFKTFDKFLFYFCDMKYHPKGVMYSYNFGSDYPNDIEKNKFRDQYIAIFNTSATTGGIELHESEGWAREYFDSL